MKYIGTSVQALPNRQLAAGKGTFVDDVYLDGMLHMAVSRSPYAHARIRSIDTQGAEAVPGVVYVITGKEVKENNEPDHGGVRHRRDGCKGRQVVRALSGPRPVRRRGRGCRRRRGQVSPRTRRAT